MAPENNHSKNERRVDKHSVSGQQNCLADDLFKRFRKEEITALLGTRCLETMKDTKEDGYRLYRLRVVDSVRGGWN